MAKKSSRPYNYSSNNRKSPKESVSKNSNNSNIENTTRIRIDSDRLNDFETLDTSFLEGRLSRSKKSKDKILKEKKKIVFNLKIIKSLIFLMGVICIFALVVFVSVNSHLFASKKSVSKKKENKKVETVKVEKKEKMIDDNYLFIGDYYTEKFSFDDLDYHYVKVSKDSYSTEDILDDMKKNIYDYNPSVVFLELGMNDLDKGMDNDEIIANMKKIIEGVQENRPYAEIYVESLYPINKDVDDYDDDILDEDIDNKKIKSLNGKIEELVKKKRVHYLDFFELLSKDDKLDSAYTDNGVYINRDGYRKIMKEVKKIVDDEK